MRMELLVSIDLSDHKIERFCVRCIIQNLKKNSGSHYELYCLALRVGNLPLHGRYTFRIITARDILKVFDPLPRPDIYVGARGANEKTHIEVSFFIGSPYWICLELSIGPVLRTNYSLVAYLLLKRSVFYNRRYCQVVVNCKL